MGGDRFPAARLARNAQLVEAAEANDVDACKQLLAPGDEGDDEWDGSADTWYADEALGWDALHYAADHGNTALVQLLLQCEGVRQSFLTDLLVRKSGEAPDLAAADEAREKETEAGRTLTLVPGSHNEVNASNQAFLASRLTFEKDAQGYWRCMDQDQNMVMAEWENEIMHASARALCEDQPAGFSILNVGFGLGIVDEAIQKYHPGRHVIIEPHPDALAFMRTLGWDQRAGVEIFEGSWEQFLMPKDDPDGEIAMKLGDFDAVYFDTYSQDYQDLRAFFECLPNVLTGPDARFSFFHGLAATDRFLYDVYTRIAELDLREIGLATTWTTLYPDVQEETWDGVKRKYWTLDDYYLPVAQLQLW